MGFLFLGAERFLILPSVSIDKLEIVYKKYSVLLFLKNKIKDLII